jgi:hypothetical protein
MNKENISSINVNCGLLLRRSFRNNLDKLIFNGYDIKYKECKNYLSSDFIIHAPQNIIFSIQNYIDKINNQE